MPFTLATLTDDSIRGNPFEPDRVPGIGGFQGTVEHNLFPLVAGFFLRGMFGGYAVSALGSGFAHTFNPATTAWGVDASIPPYSFQLDSGEPSVNSAFLMQDGYINTGDIQITAAGIVRATWGVMGKTMTLLTKAPGAAIAPAGSFPLTWAVASISINSSTNQRFKDIKISYDNKISAEDRIAGALSHTFFFRNGFQSVQIAGTLDLAQADWLDFYNANEKSLVINLVGVTSISSGVNEFMKIDVPRFEYLAYPVGVSGPGIITAAFQGRAQYLASSNTGITITLCNTFPSYAT
jgi:hypothetical protein